MTEIKPEKKSPPPRRKIPRKISPTYLHNAGLYYLQRFSASTGHFRGVMMRKIKRSCMTHPEQSQSDCEAWLDELIKTFIRCGLLNDDAYAAAMAKTLRRQGRSRRDIMARMKSKKLPESCIRRALEATDESGDGDAEIIAAVACARRKRIGPFSMKDDLIYEKELARMGRAGFSYETSRAVLNMNRAEAEDFALSN